MTSSVTNNSGIQDQLYFHTDQTKSSYDNTADKLDGQHPSSADSMLFDSLLGESKQTEDGMETPFQTGDSDLNQPNSDTLNAIPNYQLSGLLSMQGGVQIAASVSTTTAPNSTVGHPVNTSSIANTFSAVVSQVSSTISGLSPALAHTPHSFVLSIPGHSNITVHTSVTQSGTRKLQLESDELKFQTWLENNKAKLSDALAKELNVDIDLSSSGGQSHATPKQALAGQKP